jgi:hypothetical protein
MGGFGWQSLVALAFPAKGGITRAHGALGGIHWVAGFISKVLENVLLLLLASI